MTQNALNVVLRQCDDVEQYTRRNSVRIHGLPTKENEDLLETLTGCYNEVGLQLVHGEIDRIHRVGKKTYNAAKKQHTQSIIVKFRSWGPKARFYKARPKFIKDDKTVRGNQPPKRKFTVSNDLTKRRLNLLNYAREKLNDGNYHVKYVYADVNCTLAMRHNDDSLSFFNSKEAFHEIIGISDDDSDE